MEDENDLMSLFSSNQELNFSIDNDENDDSIIDDNTNDENINNDTIDEDVDSQEGVDSDEDDGSEGDDSDDGSSPNLYSSISAVLFEQGILPSLESSENIKSSDDFVNAFKQELEIQSNLKANAYLETLDLEKIATHRKDSVALDNINEDYLKSNLEVAKDIILRDYINQGLSEDRARKQLRKAIDLGEDVIIEEALESVDSLKEFNLKQEEQVKLNAQKQYVLQQEEQRQIEDNVKKQIFNNSEIIKGISNTKILQEKVYRSMTEIVSKNPNTGELENKFIKDRNLNPIEFDVKMYYLYELTNGFKDLDNISKTVNSKAVKKLEITLRKTRFEDSGAPGFLQDPESYSGGYGSELVL
jgi:hypothetical protein